MKALTSARLRELEEMAEEATPGPWMFIGEGEELDEVIGPPGGPVVCRMARSPLQTGVTYADAMFIATARDAIPELLDEVRRLAIENRRLQDENKRLHDAMAYRAEIAKALLKPPPVIYIDRP